MVQGPSGPTEREAQGPSGSTEREGQGESGADLILLSVPPDSNVLLMGEPDLASRLTERGCRVSVVRDAADDPDAAADIEFDAVVLAGTLQHVADPSELLRRVAKRLAAGGRVVASARNVTHGAVRLQLLRGRVDASLASPGCHLFDRESFEDVFRNAGLTVTDRLRVRRGLTETEAELDLGEFPADAVAAVKDDLDAETFEHVFLARPESSESAPLAEALQGRLDEVQRRLAHQNAELERELTARIQVIDDLGIQLRQSQLDVDVKDAFAHELRAELHTARQTNQALAERVARLDEELGIVRGALDQARAHIVHLEPRSEELDRVQARAGYRLVDRITGAMSSLGPVSAAARRIVRRLAR